MKIVKFYIFLFLTLILLFGCILYIMDRFVMPSVVNHGEEVVIPDVTNKNIEEAELILAEQGFKFVLNQRRKIDFSVPEGYVLEQNPHRGAISKKGRRVYLTLSSGAVPAIVPDLIGISPREAKYKLEADNLAMDSIIYDYSDDYPKGVVMGQSLQVGDTVTRGYALSLIVSLGNFPDKFIVPKLVGMNFQQATDLIAKQGLKLGEIIKVENKKFLPGTIIGQSPQAKDTVYQRSPIDIEVSE